jgi:hypothetical protein
MHRSCLYKGLEYTAVGVTRRKEKRLGRWCAHGGVRVPAGKISALSPLCCPLLLLPPPVREREGSGVCRRRASSACVAETSPNNLFLHSTRLVNWLQVVRTKVFEMVPLMVAFGHDINAFTSKKMGTLLCIWIVSAP